MNQDERDPVEVVRAFVEARYERGEWREWRDNTRGIWMRTRRDAPMRFSVCRVARPLLSTSRREAHQAREARQ